MEKFADGLWFHNCWEFSMEVVLDDKSTSGYPFDKGKSVTNAIKALSLPEYMSEKRTEQYLAKSKCKAHLAPINLLVW